VIHKMIPCHDLPPSKPLFGHRQAVAASTRSGGKPLQLKTGINRQRPAMARR
jgi:hypothetical protein